MAVALIRGYNNRYSLSDLWGQAFGDDPEFISDMYASGYLSPSDIFALTEDSRLVAAVFLPEYRIRINGNDLPIRLLSCVATDHSQRGKGYMSHLITRVLELIRKDCCGVCVIPVSEDLFDFYKKFGFKTAFYCSESVIEPGSECEDLPLVSSEDLAACYASYRKKYDKEGSVFKTEERFRQAVSEYRHVTQASDFIHLGGGFAFFQKGVSELLVREYADIDLSALAAKYQLPVRVQDPVSDSEEKKQMAMLYSFSDELSEYSRLHDLYLNCMYN